MRRRLALVGLVLVGLFTFALRCAPATPDLAAFPVHTGIISTTFWVGEIFNANTTDGSQVCSTYDSQWALHWGGVNDGTISPAAPDCAGSVYGACDGVAPAGPTSCATERRTAANGYFPSAITPRENPFYLDLPFDDLNDSTAFAERCRVIPWAKQLDPTGAHCADPSFSYMKNAWVAITGPNGKTCYGQIEDAGPGQYHDAAYVFGSAAPKNRKYNHAGMDVSPALNGCLGFKQLDGDTDKVSWHFVPANAVPAGPWLRLVTRSGVTN